MRGLDESGTEGWSSEGQRAGVVRDRGVDGGTEDWSERQRTGGVRDRGLEE